MKEFIKGYHMFLPRTWVKWCIYILYPLIIIGVSYLFQFFIFNLCLGIAGCAIVGVEYMLDGYVFAGIASKDTNRLEYLKTSVKGIPLLKKVLIADAVRRFCSITVILLGVYSLSAVASPVAGVYKNSNNAFLQVVAYILLIWLLLEIGLIILRFFINVNVILLAIYILCALVFVLGLCIAGCNIYIWQVLLLAVSCVGVVAAGRKLILKKAKESYYDIGMEEMFKND